ncbi:PIR protein, putative [Plasmodium sp. gorilla clade G1]|nr:PIR protein, putative [Plasmodium sp. gorilla clade G1]
MKLHYTKILSFSLPLNILMLSSYAHNKNKPYIISHTRTTTSRVLRECDLYMSNYDNDPDMKSVKENFERQTSQRFEEYEERMQEKRRKRKEQCDKDIKQIILKDEMEKSLSEKVEKVCLRCGCGLGGVAASVGIFGSIAVNELKKAALLAATQDAIAEGLAEGIKAGHVAGVAKVIAEIESKFDVSTLVGKELGSIFSTTNYTEASNISHLIYSEYNTKCLSLRAYAGSDNSFCSTVTNLELVPGDVSRNSYSITAVIESNVDKIVTEATATATKAAKATTDNVTATLTAKNTGVVDATYASYQTVIIASVVAILVIVLIMVIIYFILCYRRKKKMKKKQQYTKLLNQ